MLPKQQDSFWENCHHNKINIILSLYPIKVDIKRIRKLASDYGVTVSVRTDNVVKSCYEFQQDKDLPRHWFRVPLDIDGKRNRRESFKNCTYGGTCIFLQNGRLAPCALPFTSRHFNEYFGKNFLKYTRKDSVDIFKAKNIDEIFDFLCRPIPMCRYCMPEKVTTIDWGISKKRKSEWI
jgi:hypothetical protein